MRLHLYYGRVLLSSLPRVPSSSLRHLLIVPVQIANKWGIKKNYIPYTVQGDAVIVDIFNHLLKSNFSVNF
jgi:hypothetical protein